jgi:nucleoside diphosphate kinase
MATNRTFTMIKPDAVADNHIGGILSMIEQGGFRIVELQKVTLTPERAGEFYAVHKERPFYNDLVKYMSSGPIVAAILEKENAVADFRTRGRHHPEEVRQEHRSQRRARLGLGRECPNRRRILLQQIRAAESRPKAKKAALHYAERLFIYT